ncbi:MAG: serine/threonine protein kinase [Mycobacterium sp.]|nr:serine/threonine protein kinase [Mycobacterium sp.]
MEAGEVIGGRYELGDVLGRGGMAEVREAWDRRLRRAVAVKLLHPGLTAVPENRLRFEAEARAAGALASPHIVVVYDSGEYNGIPFIVMERLPGASLADEIARGPLPQPLVRDVLGDVLAALALAHDAGILHRDIKPGNLLFSGSGGVKIADFGIAKTAEAAYTMTGQIVGTIAYLSPQRLAGEPATVSDDIYAVGVVGYEALTGRRPFVQKDIGALARAILTEQPPPIAALRPDVMPALAAVVERAMARDRVRRFSSAREMRAALLGGEPLKAAPVRPATRVLDPPLPPPTYAPMITAIRETSRARKLLAAGAVFAVALAVILLAIDWPSSSPPTPVTSTTTPVPTTTTTTTTPSTTTLAPEPPPPPWHPGKKGKGGGKGEGD